MTEEQETTEQVVLLTAKQELFCQFYTKNRELFGNGTLSYAEAYGYKLDELNREKPILEKNDKGKAIKWGDSEYTLAYDVCSASASRSLRTVRINDRITALFNEILTDENVDGVLSEIITDRRSKNADRVSAIREYNRVKGRIIEKKDITSGGKPILASMHDSLVPKRAPIVKTDFDGKTTFVDEEGEEVTEGE